MSLDPNNDGWLIGKNLQATNDSFSIFRGSTSGSGGLFNILTNGKVGIGTSTPYSKLTTWGAANLFEAVNNSSSTVFLVGQNGATTTNFAISNIANSILSTNANGTVVATTSIGVSYLSGTLSIANGGTATSTQVTNSLLYFDGTKLTSAAALTFTGTNIGIGTTTPTAQLSTIGTVRFAGLGSADANLITDALGNITASSDERLKDKQGDFTRGLAAINAISPVLYKWRPERGFDTQSTYAGFFAQNVQAAIPQAVSQDSLGYLTLADRPILAALVNATKELAAISGVFKDSLIAWLGDASNGFTAIFARDIYASNVAADNIISNGTLCIRDGANDNAPLCLTKSQLAALLSAGGAAQSINVVPSPPHEDDTPPTDASDTSPQAPSSNSTATPPARSTSATRTTTSARASPRQHPTSISASSSCSTAQPRPKSQSTRRNPANTPFRTPSPRPPPASPAPSRAPSRSALPNSGLPT